MTESQLNSIAYGFIEKVIIDNEPEIDRKQKGSIENLPVIDLSNNVVSDSPTIHHKYIAEISDYAIYITINDCTYGFSQKEYITFYKFVHLVLDWNFITNKVSFDYLKEKILFWIIEVHLNNKAEKNLTEYLIEILASDIKFQKYFYPVHNLHIEEPFQIGKIELLFLTEEYFDRYWEKVRHSGNMTLDEFDSILRKYQGRVFIVCNINAEAKKGHQISYENACLAIDIITLLAPTIYFPAEKCYIDLEKRLPYRSEFLTQKTDEEFGFNLNISANNSPFYLSKEVYLSVQKHLDKLGLLFSEDKSEIDYLITNSIKLIAKSIREPDLHIRISSLIMVIESIFLLDEEEHKMENKCKRRFCELLFPDNGKKNATFSETLTKMYAVRHKMTHKAKREYIELKDLQIFQKNLVNAIMRILFARDRFMKKETLIEFLDEKIKNGA